MMRAACLVIAAIQVAACSNPVEPSPVAEVTVVEESVSANGFRLAAEVTNPGTRPIYLGGCATSLERSTTPGKWDAVWSVICPALFTNGLGLVIPAGESRTFPMVIGEQPGTNYPLLPLPPGASYRLRMGVFVPDRTEHAFKMVTSNEFTVAPL